MPSRNQFSYAVIQRNVPIHARANQMFGHPTRRHDEAAVEIVGDDHIKKAWKLIVPGFIICPFSVSTPPAQQASHEYTL